MLQNPAAGNEAMFKRECLRFTDIRPATLVVAIMYDPGRSRKRGSDRHGVPRLGNGRGTQSLPPRLLDGYHHKMGLTERWQRLRDLRRKWMNEPGIQFVKVGYERYGAEADFDYFQERWRSSATPSRSSSSCGRSTGRVANTTRTACTRSLDGTTPARRACASSPPPARAALRRYAWEEHCGGLFHIPIPA
jgi:hypothetical protein